ncbi:MAG: 4-alpha-glucanotransferase, partial [Aquificaceae bacterium]|nr:4-alpha-glucanotransferase [Aquificaceae bacterium]
HNHTYNSTVYTSTHDTMPVRGWFHEEIDEYTRAKVLDYLGYVPENISHAFVRLAYMSVAKYCIVPMQDLLGLGGESRINTPGTVQGNWAWRMKNLPKEELKEFLTFLCHTYGR